MVHDNEGSAATSDGGETPIEQRDTSPPPAKSRSDKAIDETVPAVRDLQKGVQPSNTSQSGVSSTIHAEEPRPPLPPRPGNLDLLQEGNYGPGGSVQRSRNPVRPQLQSTATIALSRTDINTLSYQDGSRDTYAASAETTPPSKPVGLFGSIKRFKGLGGSETGDSTSVKSYVPTLEAGGDVESLLGEVLGASQQSPAWKLLSTQYETPDPFDSVNYEDDEATVKFYREFDDICQTDPDVGSEGSTILVFEIVYNTVLTWKGRAAISTMAIEAEAFPYLILSW